jgi:hypothetical protein
MLPSRRTTHFANGSNTQIMSETGTKIAFTARKRTNGASGDDYLIEHDVNDSPLLTG